MARLDRNGWKYLLVAFVFAASFVSLGILWHRYAHATRPRTSSIVLTYRNSGGLNTDVASLRDFLRGRPALAVQLNHDCFPIEMEINRDRDSETGRELEMSWASSDEGHICLIAREASAWPVEVKKGDRGSQ
jgi:hypothetical protein